MAGLRRVIVGVSGSPGSLRALRYAADLARGGDVPLLAVLAWVPPGGDLAERRTPSPYLRAIWQDAASQRLRDALESAWGGVPADLLVQRIVARGDTGRVLVDVADATDDLLVVGAGAHGALSRPWHGKVTRYCIAHGSCPVLAVPPSPLPKRARGLRFWSLPHRRIDADQLLGRQAGSRPAGPRSCHERG